MTTINKYQQYLENVKRNATTLRMELDSNYPRHIRQQQYLPHMDDCIYNPTIGLTARQEIIHNHLPNFPSQFSKNLHHLRKSEKYKYFSDIIEERLNQLYPKTKNLRKFLIEENHLSLYFVKRKQKLNLLSKLKLMLMR